MHWTIVGKQESSCDGIGRRNFLKVGALAGAGLTLADWLRPRAARAESPRSKPRSAILVFLAGGPSHFETFDPKPNAPLEFRGPFAPIETNVPGIAISETLPLLGKSRRSVFAHPLVLP